MSFTVLSVSHIAPGAQFCVWFSTLKPSMSNAVVSSTQILQMKSSPSTSVM